MVFLVVMQSFHFRVPESDDGGRVGGCNILSPPATKFDIEDVVIYVCSFMAPNPMTRGCDIRFSFS